AEGCGQTTRSNVVGVRVIDWYRTIEDPVGTNEGVLVDTRRIVSPGVVGIVERIKIGTVLQGQEDKVKRVTRAGSRNTVAGLAIENNNDLIGGRRQTSADRVNAIGRFGGAGVELTTEYAKSFAI